MVKKVKGVMVIAIVSILFVMLFVISLAIMPLASAEIFISKQPDSIYNLGEEFSITIGSDGAKGWASVNLVCSNDTKLIYYHYMTDKDTSIDINLPLTTDSLKNMVGVCHLSTIFNNVAKQGATFEISNRIDISLTLNEKEISPNSTITFQGTASKPNGLPIDGSADVSVKELGLSVVVPIIDNSFSGEISLLDSSSSKNYELSVFAYEKDELGEITNFGNYSDSFLIKQEPRELKLEISKTSINPNEALEFKSTLYDQAGMTIDQKPSAFKIITSTGEEVVNILSETGTSNYYTLRKNAPKGIWNISSESEGIQQKTQFYVSENKEALFEFLNNTLFITNIGNVPYDKLVEIKIGNHSEVKNFNLSLGSSVEFKLYAPDGEYEISASDGELNLSRRAMLTGSVISIGEPDKRSLNMFNRSILAWVILIAILGTFIFLTSKRIINKKMVFGIGKFGIGKANKPLDNEMGKGGIVKLTPPGKSGSGKVESSSEAHHTLVTDGSKQTAAFVALKIKNFEELRHSKSNAFDNINDAVREISNNHGKIYRNEDFIVGIFAPSETKTFDNSLVAIKTAEEISRKLKEHNSKFVHKINFGIGINSGDVASKKENGKLLFTPLGSSMIIAKKVAEVADKRVLMSEEAHRKMNSKVKAIPQAEKAGMRTFAIGEIIERNQGNSKFIEDFLKRNKEYKQLNDFRAGK